MAIPQPSPNTARPERSPFALDRGLRAETAYVLLSAAVSIGLIVSGQLVWALAWLMATLFMFGIWSIARGQLK